MADRQSRHVTIRQVAARAACSPATVSYVLNGQYHQMSEVTAARVRAAIAELGYVPSAAAKALRTRRSAALALVVPSVSAPFFAQFMRGAEDAALAAGYTLFACSSDYSPSREQTYAQVLLERQVEGVIFASSVLHPGHVVELRRRGVGIVLLETETATPQVDTVIFDDARAAQIAVEHLASLGHRRIAFVTAPLSRRPLRDRKDGYLAGLAAHGLEIDPGLIIEGPLQRDPRTGHPSLALGHSIAERLMSQPDAPTAVFAHNDMSAVIVAHGLLERGARVPEDVSVMGCYDIGVAALFRPALSTVARPAYEMGAAAAGLLIARLVAARDGEEPPGQVVRFEPRLVVRASTAPRG